MKTKNFTFKSLFVIGLFVLGPVALYAQDMTSTGTGWSDLNPTSPLILKEDFTGFDFYGNWAHTNNSNSKEAVDEVTGDTIPANISGTKTITFLNSELEVIYTWDSCAFAPEWGVAYSLDSDGIPVDPDPTTSGVSNGFVEIARNGYGTLAGEFIIDLRNADFIEAIQYSHSSCGGYRRGFMLQFSLDNGETWDTLRYQLGDHYTMNFTKDPFFPDDKISNDINCTPSGNGMLWEDALYSENVMLMFSSESVESQAVRLHDFKVYGELPDDPGSAVSDVVNNFNLKFSDGHVVISEKADIYVFEVTGKLVKRSFSVRSLSLTDVPDGIYIVKAQNNRNTASEKIVIR